LYTKKKFRIFQKSFAKPIDKPRRVWYNIYRKEVREMKKPNQKTTIQIVELVLKAVVAVAALITAIRWW